MQHLKTQRPKQTDHNNANIKKPWTAIHQSKSQRKESQCQGIQSDITRDQRHQREIWLYLGRVENNILLLELEQAAGAQ